MCGTGWGAETERGRARERETEEEVNTVGKCMHVPHGFVYGEMYLLTETKSQGGIATGEN